MPNLEPSTSISLLNHLAGMMCLAVNSGNYLPAGQTADEITTDQDDAGTCVTGCDLEAPIALQELAVARNAESCFRSSARALFQLGLSWDEMVDLLIRVRFEDLLHPVVDRDRFIRAGEDSLRTQPARDTRIVWSPNLNSPSQRW